MLNEAVITE